MTTETMTLGYARMGKHREIKKALEAFWHGGLETDTLLATVQEIEAHGWKTQLDAGIDRIAVGGQTLYDQGLDWAIRLGLITARL